MWLPYSTTSPRSSTVVRCMVSSAAFLRSLSSRISAAVAVRAPMLCAGRVQAIAAAAQDVVEAALFQHLGR